MFEDKMKKIAEYFIANNIDIKYDYNKKYNLTEIDFIEVKLEEKSIIEDIGYSSKEEVIDENLNNEVLDKVKSYEQLVDELKKYRNYKAREENIKPYYIYNDEMIEEIIKLNPDNKKKLIQIIGFGPSKIDKYGQDIIDILRE